MFKLAGVYKITNVINKKIYIGESEDISRRWVEHLTDLSLNQHCNGKLQTDFNIYGIDSFKFEILESVPIDLKNNNINQFTLKLVLLCREHAYIHECNSIKEGYNIEDTYNKLYNNDLDMFMRTKKATKNETKFVHQYMKNHTYLLSNESGITLDTIFVKRLNSIHDLSRKIDEYNTKYNIDVSIDNVNKPMNNINYSNLTEIYHNCLSSGIITNYVSLNMFKRILQKYNIICFKDHSWRATQESIDKKYIVLGKEKINKCNFTYRELYTTELCEREVNKILYSIDVKQTVEEISKQPFYS